MVKILSFDSAYCTLGVWYFDIDIDYDGRQGKWFDNVFIDVINTLGAPLNSLTDTEKTRRFCKTIKSHPIISPKNISPHTIVLIEHQPPSMGRVTNIHSMAASYQLAALYSDFNVQFVNPKKKQKISMFPTLEYTEFVEPGMTSAQLYAARKKHSAVNFRVLVQLHKLDISHISRAHHDDAADPIMNAIAHLYC